MTEEQAADYLGLKKTTLANWRATRRYDLAFVKCGRLVRYKLADLDAFIARRTVATAPADAELN